MECKAITNTGTQCSRIAELNSNYCWQHRNYEIKGNISTQYFQNVPLLQNTLLSYFKEEEPLKNINKQFRDLNYEKYNTHIEPHGVKITYFPETKIMESRASYINGDLDGLSESWYENGQLMEKIEYKNGKLNGLYEVWYLDGKLDEKSHYKNDKYDGLSERYLNGKLYEKVNYKNRLYNGLYEVFYPDGQLSIKKNYKDGILDGLYENWYENGELKTRKNYKDDKLNGLYEKYDGKGKLISKKIYKNNKSVLNFHP